MKDKIRELRNRKEGMHTGKSEEEEDMGMKADLRREIVFRHNLPFPFGFGG